VVEQECESEVACTNECLTFAHVFSTKLLLLVGLADGPLAEVKIGPSGECLLLLHSTIYNFISTVYIKPLRLSFTFTIKN